MDSFDFFRASATPEQRLMLDLLVRDTRLKIQWAYRCLSENDFDYAKAVNAFRSLVDQIPPEAYESHYHFISNLSPHG